MSHVNRSWRVDIQCAFHLSPLHACMVQMCFKEALLDIIAFQWHENNACCFLLFQIGSGADLTAPRRRLLLAIVRFRHH